MTQDKNELLDILKHVTIFAGIDDEGLRRIYDLCRIESYPSGSTIVREGELATEIYLILSGRVKVVLNWEKDPLEIVELPAGHCFGETSVIGIQAHSATVVATLPTEVLVLSRTVLMDTQAKDTGLFSLLILNIARELARRLYRTDQILLQYASRLNGAKKTDQ